MRQADSRNGPPTCPACYREFNGSECEPRIFKVCGHSICKSCLEDWIKLTTRCQVKCPICGRPQRFSRSDTNYRESFPVNFDLRSALETQQYQIQTDDCVIHGQENSLLCLDAKCSRKHLSCALCIRNFHANCKGEYIVSARNIEERVEFVTNQNRREPVKEMVSDQLAKIFEDFRQCFVQKTDAMVEALIPETPEIGIHSISQLQAYHNQLNYKLNSQTKIISIRRKDEETREEKIQTMKDRLDRFFSDSFSNMLENFLNQNFEETDQPPENNSVVHQQGQTEPDLQSQNNLQLQATPKDTSAHPIITSEANNGLQASDIEGNILSIEVNRQIRNLTDDKFIAIEFTNFEGSRIELLSPIFPNYQFMQFNQTTDSALFHDFAIEVTPTYLCFFRKGNEIRRLRIEQPTINELEDLLFQVAFTDHNF
jgi:hypothetical protein